MSKRLKIFTILICTIAFIIIFVGTTIINKESWQEIREDFYNSKVNQVDFYFSKTVEEVTALIHANAAWTELKVKMVEKDTRWLKGNATGYLIENEHFKIDFVLVANEELSFTNHYGDEVMESIMTSRSFNRGLIDNVLSAEILWIDEKPILVVATPITNDEYNDPSGVYVLARWINDAGLQDLKNILGKDILSGITLTKEKKYNHLIEKNYSTIQFSYPIQVDESLDFINLEFNTPLYRNAFHVQKLHIFANILTAGVICIILAFFYIKQLTRGVNEIIQTVKKISNGDYAARIKETNIEEIQQLALSVNKMATDITSRLQEIDKSYLEMIEIMANSIEINNEYTSHHNMRVANFSRIIGEILSFEDMEKLHIAARLHDIGKLAVPTEIINKPGKLTPEEYEIVKEHPLAGFRIMDSIDFFKEIKYGILYHHERYDGKGYPHGLRGDEIPMIAQIISVADVFDALASNRPYRQAYGYMESLNMLKENSGKMFNPIIIEAFVGVMEELYDLNIPKRV